LLPSGLAASVTVSVHCARSVGPMPRFSTVHCTCSAPPDWPLAGALTLVTCRSAYGIGITSNPFGAAAVLLASEPFSNTTPRPSARTSSV
jgi:hypothetical protein